MSDPIKQSWDDVADGFTNLGKAVKNRYEGAAQSGPDVAGATREAVDGLVDSLRQLGDKLAGVVKDDDLRSQTNEAIRTLADALSTTVDTIGDQVGGFFRRKQMPHDDVPDVDAVDGPIDVGEAHIEADDTPPA